MATTKGTRSLTRRTFLKTGLVAFGAGTAGVFGPSRWAPAQMGRAKPFAGTTINASCFSAPYSRWLADYLPEFTEETGITVNYETPAFSVYNPRMDLELSTKGSAYDVLNITFIYSSRWIGEGWFRSAMPCSMLVCRFWGTSIRPIMCLRHMLILVEISKTHLMGVSLAASQLKEKGK